MLLHKGTITIETARFTLRKFNVEDTEAMFNYWANDERVTKYLTWLPHSTPENTKTLLEAWCAEYVNPNYYNWAIEYDGNVIGNISVVIINDKHEYAELGYCMGYTYWNKGIMTEAANAVIAFLFEQVKVNRIAISHAVKNPASGRVAQKCGLVYEGTKRAFYKDYKGEFHDISYYSILRKEWENKSNGA